MRQAFIVLTLRSGAAGVSCAFVTFSGEHPGLPGPADQEERVKSRKKYGLLSAAAADQAALREDAHGRATNHVWAQTPPARPAG